MRYWILAISLFVLGCGSEPDKSVGEEVADDLKNAQDKAAEVEELLEDNKKALDEALDEAEGT
jgi:hypothetical protein